MKKTVLLITLLISGFALKAQEINKSRFRLGFHCYPGVSTIYGETFRDKTAGLRFSYGFGITGEIAINDNMIISLGLQYIKKGYEVEDHSYFAYNDYFSFDTVIVVTSTYYNEDFKINSLSIPITFKYYIGNRIRYYGLLGGYASYLINHFVILEHGFAILNKPAIYQAGLEVESTVKSDFGIIIGTGVNIPIKEKINFEIGPTACLGIKDFFSPIYTFLFHPKITDPNQKNMVLSLEVTVLLHF